MKLVVPSLSDLRCDCGSGDIAAIKVGYQDDDDKVEVADRAWCPVCWIRSLRPRRPPLFDRTPQ